MKRLNLRVANKKTSNLKLISSAIKNISEKGINETTMSDVSQGAGLSQGIVNFHFKSKELLLIETLKYVSNEYLESFQTSLKKSGSDPRKKIIAIINNDFSVEVKLKVPNRAIAPGQACVFYQGEHVLGGGWIEKAH